MQVDTWKWRSETFDSIWGGGYLTWLARQENAANIASAQNARLKTIPAECWVRACEDVRDGDDPPRGWSDRFERCVKAATARRGSRSPAAPLPPQRCPHCNGSGSGGVGIVILPGTSQHETLRRRYGIPRDRVVKCVARCVCVAPDPKCGTFRPGKDMTQTEYRLQKIQERPWYRPGMSWTEMTAAREAERRGTRITSNRKPDGTRKDRAPEYER